MVSSLCETFPRLLIKKNRIPGKPEQVQKIKSVVKKKHTTLKMMRVKGYHASVKALILFLLINPMAMEAESFRLLRTISL